MNISDVLRKVKQDVNEESEGKQLPSVVDNSIGGEFFFTKESTSAQPVPVNTVKPTPAQPVKKEVAVQQKSTVPVKKEPVVEKDAAEGLDYGYGLSYAATTTVGSQQWISKNLNVSTFANSEPIAEARTPDEWKAASDQHRPAWCHYNNDPSGLYGKLYNWYAVHDPRGLAPKGWHIPTDEEWASMINSLGGETVAGSALKSTDGWASKGNGSNNSGMASLPGGFRYSIGKFSDVGKSGYWWSDTEFNAGGAWCRNLFNYNDRVFRGHDYKGCGFSVRCIKD